MWIFSQWKRRIDLYEVFLDRDAVDENRHKSRHTKETPWSQMGTRNATTGKMGTKNATSENGNDTGENGYNE